MNISQSKELLNVEFNEITDVIGLIDSSFFYLEKEDEVKLERTYATILETFKTYQFTFNLLKTFKQLLNETEELFAVSRYTDYENFEELADMFRALQKNEFILQNDDERFLLNFKEDFIKDGIIELIDEEHSLYAIHSLDNYFDGYYGESNINFNEMSKEEKVKHIQSLQQESLAEISNNEFMAEHCKEFSIMTDIYHADTFLSMYVDIHFILSNRLYLQ